MENLSCSRCWLLHRHNCENSVKRQSEMYANIRWKDEDKRNWNFGKICYNGNVSAHSSWIQNKFITKYAWQNRSKTQIILFIYNIDHCSSMYNSSKWIMSSVLYRQEYLVKNPKSRCFENSLNFAQYGGVICAILWKIENHISMCLNSGGLRMTFAMICVIRGFHIEFNSL